jgi:hypothetical protein
VIDDTDHQGQTAPPDDTPIYHQGERLLRQIGEQALGDGQEPALDSGFVELEPATETGDETFLVSAVAGSMISNRGEMGTLGATQATDEGNQGGEMTFLMTGGVRMIELHQAVLYGTIPAVRVRFSFIVSHRFHYIAALLAALMSKVSRMLSEPMSRAGTKNLGARGFEESGSRSATARSYLCHISARDGQTNSTAATRGRA